MDQEREVQEKLKITAKHALLRFMATASRILPSMEAISSCKTNINLPLIMDRKTWGKTLKVKVLVSTSTVLMVLTTIPITMGDLSALNLILINQKRKSKIKMIIITILAEELEEYHNKIEVEVIKL